MEFFHQPKFDWMGKKWYFIACSLALAVVGLVSIAVHRGLAYGFDFRGGTLVYVKFARQPNIDAVRRELDSEGLRGARVQQYDTADKHEFIVGLDLRTTAANQALDTGKRDILTALTKLYGTGPEGKADFNNASPQTVADHLIAADPLLLASKGTETATKTYQDLAQAMVTFRNSTPRSGLVGSFDELKAVSGVTSGVIDALGKDFYLSGYAV